MCTAVAATICGGAQSLSSGAGCCSEPERTCARMRGVTTSIAPAPAPEQRIQPAPHLHRVRMQARAPGRHLCPGAGAVRIRTRGSFHCTLCCSFVGWQAGSKGRQRSNSICLPLDPAFRPTRIGIPTAKPTCWEDLSLAVHRMECQGRCFASRHRPVPSLHLVAGSDTGRTVRIKACAHVPSCPALQTSGMMPRHLGG